ncbi:response regulator transcription factor [Pararhodobacter sp. CCB-MM2]|uniref:response regulator transcription factor n=1 Tax=Pararhodobacter sp. CCB-MM2 TaxID=1786003 RepID=UPI00082FCAD7|nr:response regulator transcription factor [Pararhodobacter sp. CCB-MM2]
MKILLVEDDSYIATGTKRGLESAGYSVTWESDGVAALDRLYEESYKLIILDLLLPKLGGLNFLKLIRNEDIEIPVMIVSALDSEDMRIAALDCGADDFVVKPVSSGEISARARAILRRSVGLNLATTFSYKGLVLDVGKHSVQRDGKTISLTNREFMLLVLLLENKEQVLSRDFILESIWDMNFTSNGSVVDVCIRRLRAKVDESFKEKLLHTVRGRGYVLR